MINLSVKSSDGVLYKIVPSTIHIGNSESNNVVKLHFDLPEHFQGLVKRVTFKPEYGSKSYERLLDAFDELEIDGNVTLSNGLLTLDAYDENVRYTTTNVRYDVEPHLMLGGSKDKPITDDIEKLVIKAVTASEKAIMFADKAQASEVNAQTSERNAETSEVNAKESEQNAKESENQAKSYFESAASQFELAKAEAEKSKSKATESATSATKAKTSEENAKSSETKAQEYEQSAKSSSESASASSQSASESLAEVKVEAKKISDTAGKIDNLDAKLDAVTNEIVVTNAPATENTEILVETAERVYKLVEESDLEPVKSEIGQLNESLSEVDDAVFEKREEGETEIAIPFESHTGEYFYSLGDSATSLRVSPQDAGGFVIVDIEPNKKYRFSCMMYRSTYGLGYAILNSSNVLLTQVYDASLSGWTEKTVEIIAPNDASKLYINTRNYLSPNPRRVDATSVKVERYERKVDSEEIRRIAEYGKNWAKDKKPTICFIFDQTFDDNRRLILEDNGFRGTFSINNPSTKVDVIKTLVKHGHDLSVYGGIGSTPLYTGDTKNEWKAFIKGATDMLNDIGIFLPTMYSCMNHKGSWNLVNACKSLGFKYVSCGALVVNSENYDSSTVWLTTKDNSADATPIRPFKLPTLSWSDIKTGIDDAVDNNYILCIFTHLADPNITEPSQSNVNCSESILRQTVEYVKTLYDSGQVDVLTMRELYNKYHKSEGEALDYTRIMSGIVAK